MNYPNLNVDTESFLADVWQTKPLLIRQAFKDFSDPIDEHDLAGLAQELEIDSRIVSFKHNEWSVVHGPFAEFESHCQGLWTLMVQGVDKWIEDISDLAKVFNFIPNWRFDDVMVSYSVPGAGVGPHVDQYDVFLLQGKGKRHWQVGSPDHVVTTLAHQNLQQVKPFSPIIDVVLEPGDILYIPPGWPHCGVSVEDCLTYSIGFRAPNARDLLQPINDTLFNSETLERYGDPKLRARESSYWVLEQEIAQLTELAQSSLSGKAWTRTLLQHLSEQALPIEPLAQQYSEQDICSRLNNHNDLQMTPGCRPLFYAGLPNEVFINGRSYGLHTSINPLILDLLNSEQVDLGGLADSPECVALFTSLINDGILCFTADID